MTKKILWRLKEVPTSESLRELVKDGILSKDEAREILFSQEEQTDRTKESLEQEIKFLRELVDKLSSRLKIVEIIKEVEKPYLDRWWYNPYRIWCDGITTYSTYANGITGNTTTIPRYNYTSNFSSINTF
jgi:hypothetical protein